MSTIERMRFVLCALAITACSSSPSVDGGELVDAGATSVDAGELVDDAGRARDAGADGGHDRDGGRVELDAGADAGPDAGPLPSCVGEGIWRNDTIWCEHLPNVLADYDCDLIADISRAGDVTWSGDAESIRTLTFVLQYQGLSPVSDQMYACHRSAPVEAYSQGCEVPFRRPCEVLAGERDAVRCAAADDRGIASIFAFRATATGCGN